VLPQATAHEAAGSVRLALREANLESLTGLNLLGRLREILEASPFLLAQAAQAIQALVKQIKIDLGRLNTAIGALEDLNFSAEDGEENVYEIGILMPSHVTKDDLRVIKSEFDEWIFVINHIQELVTGQPAATIPVRSMSSGSLDLFCGFHASGAEAMLILTLGAYTILQFVRDAQRRRKELEELKYPETVIEPMVKHEKDLIGTAKADIVKKLLTKKSKELAKHRDHELETALKHAVAFVLRRVNEGVDVEVSTPPHAEETREQAAVEVRELQASIEKMRLEMRQIVALLPDRTKPILQLPEPTPDEKLPPEKGPARASEGSAEVHHGKPASKATGKSH